MKALKPSEQLAALEKEEAELLAKIGNRKQSPEERQELDRLDEAIKALRANGTYQQINQKYFKYDIYGG